MKKIILFILIFLGLGLANNAWGDNYCMCCSRISTNIGPGSSIITQHFWEGKCESFFGATENAVDNEECFIANALRGDNSNCVIPPRQSPSGGLKSGTVTVTWVTKTVSVCPPGIFGVTPCNYPNLIDLIKKINQFLLTISPPLLLFLIVLGALMYLLTPFNVEEQIKRGHNYIKYAILGFTILLLVTLIFEIISGILGGPSP